MSNFLGMPYMAAQHGAAIDRTVLYTHVLMFALFIGWGMFFLWTLFRYRAGRNPVADYKGVTSHTSSYLEVAVAVAEGVLLFGFSVPLWMQRVDRIPPESESVVLEVTGEQFAWNVRYPGVDGKFGRTDIKLIDLQTNPLGLDREDEAAKDDIVTLNQVHLPKGKPAIIRLRSKDVIHGFNLPEFRIKQDLVPGLTIPVWFVPTVTTAEMREKTGNPEFQYEIACAQLCGLGHYRMRGFITIDTPEEFQAWKDAEAAKLQESGEDAWN
jgi:cytochrome c oxidase subunit II